MFDWLFEGRLAVYVVLAVMAAPLLYVGIQRRERRYLVAGSVIVALIGVYFLLSRLRETDRAQVRRKLEEMAAAVKDRDADRILAHVSEKFATQGMDRQKFRRYVEGRLRGRWLEELAIWDIDFPDGAKPDADGIIRVTFRVRPKGPHLGTPPPFLGEASFVRDPDGQWRMTGFNVFHPFIDSHIPLDLP